MRIAAVAATLCLLLLGGLPAAGQTAAPPANFAVGDKAAAQPGTLTAEWLDAKIKEIDAADGLAEALKANVLEQYRAAASRVELVKTNIAKAEAYQQAIGSAPQETHAIAEQLKDLVGQAAGPVPVETPPGTTAKDLEQLLATQQAELAALKSKLVELDQQLNSLQTRPDQARQQLADAKQKLDGIEKELKAPATPNDDALLTEAKRVFLEARKLSRVTEINTLEQELLSHPARLDLSRAQRDLSAQQVAVIESRVLTTQEAVNRLRKEEAEEAQRQAERIRHEAVGQHPAVLQLAEQNAEFSKDLSQLTGVLERATASHQSVTKQLELIDKDFKSAQEKLQYAGISDVLGQVLRQQRRSLPDIHAYHRSTSKRKKQVSEVGLAYLRVEDRRRELSDLPGVLHQLMSLPFETPQGEVNRVDLEKQTLKLLEDQREMLSKLADTYSKSLQALAELDFAEKMLIDRAGQYATFLDERLLWIPSAAPVGWETWQNLGGSVAWLADPAQWAGIGLSLWYEALSVPIAVTGLGLVVLVGLLVTRPSLRSRLAAYDGQVGRVDTDSFWVTLAALGTTLLLSAPFPLALWMIYWMLQRPAEIASFAKAVSTGLIGMAWWLLALEWLGLLCKSKGFAEVHLRWREQSTGVLRRNLMWGTPVAMVVVFLVTATEWHEHLVYRQSLGRVAFIVGMAVMGVFAQRVLRLNGGVSQQYLARYPKGWVSRLRWLWYPLVVGGPFALAGLAAVGYYYTALMLARRMAAAGMLVIVAVIVQGLAFRWLIIAQRRLALERARQKREAEMAARAAAGSQEGASEGEQVPLDVAEVNLATINSQTRQLLRVIVGASVAVGLWVIWSDVLPALGILNDVHLWYQTAVVEGQETLKAVTLADLGLAVVVAVVTVLAARNLPGFMEIMVLQHMPMEPGVRYAITTISRYALTAVGVVAVFGAVGIGWSKVQWLVAALSVGLGFGLQEIVANFVSGLIILLERPIRVGDTVTIDDISGTVSRIKIRATTITDWDRKELIVPNKSFITDRLINWTLSDPVTRLIVKVGIAYGSDTELALRLMMDVAKRHPSVQDEPEPTVYFLGFGDSSLDFQARVFVTELTNRGRAEIIHDLHMAIDKTFREHGVVIAFPQRDVHIHQAQPPAPRGGQNNSD